MSCMEDKAAQDSRPDVGGQLSAGPGMLVQLLLQHGCIVREALLPSEGISGQLFFPLVKGQLCPPVPLVLWSDK